MSIGTPLGIGKRRLVYTRIANEPINRFAHSELIYILAKLANGVEGIELAIHGGEIIHIKLIQFCNGFHFVDVTDSTYNMVLSCAKECLGGLATETG